MHISVLQVSGMEHYIFNLMNAPVAAIQNEKVISAE